MKKILAVALFFFPLFLTAQISLRIGYEPAFAYATENSHTAYFNKNKAGVTSKFPELHLLQAMQVGFHFEGEEFDFDVFWNGRFAKQEAAWQDATTKKDSSRRINFRFNGIGAAGVYKFGAVGFGAGVDFGQLYFRGKLPDEKKGQRLVNSQNGGLYFFMDWHPGASANNSVSLRPFYYLPFHRIDISSVNAWLNGAAAGSQKLETSIQCFGLTMIFYNKLTERN